MGIPVLRSNQFGSALGEALGMGIGNYAGNKMASRSLQKVTQNPNYAGMSTPQKKSALQEALGFYGQRGQNLMESELQNVAQQDAQKETSRLGQLLQDPNSTPESKLAAILSSNLPEGQKKSLLTSFANVTRANATANKPKAASKFDPIPDEQLKAIEAIQNSPEYANMNANQKALAYQKAGVNPEETKKILERESDEESKAMDYDKRSEKYIDEARQAAKEADNTLIGIDQIQDALDKGVDSFGAIRSTAEAFLPKQLMDTLLTPDQATFEAAIPNLLEGMKDLFGIRLSDADLRLVRDKLPSLSKSPEANQQILDFLRKMAEFKKLKYKIAKEEERKYPKNRPATFTRDVEDKYETEAQKLKDNYFAELRLTPTAYKEFVNKPVEKGFIRLVGPQGDVLLMPENDKEGIDALRTRGRYLQLQSKIASPSQINKKPVGIQAGKVR